ncbi:MAG: hypothetical protein J5793_01110, partial [Clostridia bacterium]|nr:hypothetical protein [Clostridia bacterium]
EMAEDGNLGEFINGLREIAVTGEARFLAYDVYYNSKTGYYFEGDLVSLDYKRKVLYKCANVLERKING